MVVVNTRASLGQFLRLEVSAGHKKRVMTA